MPFLAKFLVTARISKNSKMFVSAYLRQIEAVRRADYAHACRSWCATAVARFCSRFFRLLFSVLTAAFLARIFQISVRLCPAYLCAHTPALVCPPLFSPSLRVFLAKIVSRASFAREICAHKFSFSLPSAFERSSCSAPLAAFGAPMTASAAVPRFCVKRLRAPHCQRCVETLSRPGAPFLPLSFSLPLSLPPHFFHSPCSPFSALSFCADRRRALGRSGARAAFRGQPCTSLGFGFLPPASGNRCAFQTNAPFTFRSSHRHFFFFFSLPCSMVTDQVCTLNGGRAQPPRRPPASSRVPSRLSHNVVLFRGHDSARCVSNIVCFLLRSYL